MEKNQKRVGVKPSAKVLKKYCAQRFRGLLYWRFFVTDAYKYKKKFGLKT